MVMSCQWHFIVLSAITLQQANLYVNYNWLEYQMPLKPSDLYLIDVKRKEKVFAILLPGQVNKMRR